MSQLDKDADQTVRRGSDRGRGAWQKLAVAVFLLPACAVLLPSAIVLAITMLPAFVALSVDRVPGRAFTVTVAMLNASGSMPAIIELWSRGHTLSAAQDVLGNPIFWMLAYLAAALGWLIFLMLPPIMRRYYGVITQTRVGLLERRQEKLRDVWGEAVTGMQARAEQQETAEEKIETAAEDLDRGPAPAG